jgi:hypothetical protein
LQFRAWAIPATYPTAQAIARLCSYNDAAAAV